ncbi:MAG: LysM domain-containing protein, partial [bacterium]|nr:LysM domain-containing protein [bacterium]
MVIPKNRIRLSRSLHSQITPYPNAGKFIKRTVFLVLLFGIAGIYFFINNDPQPQSEPLPKQILGEQEEALVPQFDTYKIKKGDTLFNLSQALGVSWKTLAEINNLAEPYVLHIGQ